MEAGFEGKAAVVEVGRRWSRPKCAIENAGAAKILALGMDIKSGDQHPSDERITLRL
jgi:hypothetical protein